MNELQKKIFLKKILPKLILAILFFAASIVVIGVFQYIHYLEKENTEFYQEQKAKENKIKETIVEKKIGKLKLDLRDWKIVKEMNYPEMDLYGLILSNNYSTIDIIYTKHKYITEIEEYAEYANEKTVRNLKLTGFELVSEKKEIIKFNNLDAVKETFKCFSKSSSEKLKSIALNFKLEEYFYTINYRNSYSSEMFISNIRIE